MGEVGEQVQQQTQTQATQGSWVDGASGWKPKRAASGNDMRDMATICRWWEGLLALVSAFQRARSSVRVRWVGWSCWVEG
jgi:hypothetical protein